MELSVLLVLLLFATLFAWLLAGYPVAFTLAGTALMFAAIGVVAGVLEPRDVAAFPDRIYGTVQNELLLAIPLFVAMGVMLERSKVAEDLLESMGRLFGPLRGGLGISVTVVGALLAASTGIVGATVVTMGLLSLPTMLRRGYDPHLATGAIAAAGTLGQIIPPSIVLILLGDVLSSAYQQAQRSIGVTAPEPLSVGELFAGALLPGLMLVGLYVLYQVGMAVLRPASSPAIARPADEPFNLAFLGHLLRALLPPVVLIVAVLGSILGGIATPTEAAAVGAVGAILLGGLRCGRTRPWPIFMAAGALVLLLALAATTDLRLARADVSAVDRVAFGVAVLASVAFAGGLGAALVSSHRAGVLGAVLTATVRITTMIFAILIGAALFALVFRGFGGDAIIEDFLTGLPGGTTTALVLVMLVMFTLGFFLDFIEIIFVVVPIVAPVLLMLGIDPVWLGVMMAVNLQTSFLTPPFGFALFYLRGVAPDSVRTAQIYRGVIPFVIIQIVGLALLAAVPGLATWLPGVFFD